MVEQADLGQVKALSDERIAISNALYAIEAGGEITSFTVGLTPNIPNQLVASDYIEYPPQMMPAIQKALEDRQEEIVVELAKLGVTELGPLPPPAWATPPPEVVPPPPREPPPPPELNVNTPRPPYETEGPRRQAPARPQPAPPPRPAPKPAPTRRKRT